MAAFNECTNTDTPYEAKLYLQIVYMFVGLGTKVLLELFLYLLKHDEINMSLVDFLKSNETKQKLIKLRNDKVINEKEHRLAKADNPKTDDFDISLLLILMRNLLPNEILSPPTHGWTKPPPRTDNTISADLLRLRKIRNDIIAHITRPQIPEPKYDRTRDELIHIFYRLTQKIHPCKSKDAIMKEIQERIDSYQVSVDSPLTNLYISRVQEWNLNFTKKVEESLKTLNEFDLYLTNRSK
ncbi:uncharacterized protein LOC132757549 [Ruditapes philippinarum]|uniref:uncharacterized protein LOC132757549 n=1 Tax=Ruditapes philippinarum TaxID=129788 RepID=UPI00295BC144|nr:uncharacterized protein LOC132757549 [Ruditapes philippinarum]